MELELITLLTERIRTDKNNPEYIPTQDELDAENVVYQAELVQAIYDALVVDYNNIKREGDAALTGSETKEELITMIEVIARELAVVDYTNLSLVHIEKPELTVEMDSKAIISLIQSLESQEVTEVERLRRIDLQVRFDALADDTMNTINSAHEHVANLKYFRNVTLVGDCKRTPMTNEEAEACMVACEAALPAIKAERLAKEAKVALDKAAEVIINRANAGMKYIVSFNMSKISAGELDSAGLDSLEVLFAEALSKIQSVRPDKAADVIVGLDITGTIYTETERTELINILRGL